MLLVVHMKVPAMFIGSEQLSEYVIARGIGGAADAYDGPSVEQSQFKWTHLWPALLHHTSYRSYRVVLLYSLTG